MPLVAPASTLMLQMARRPLVDIFWMVLPWNSRTRKLAPWAVSLPMRCRIRSLGPTCFGNVPFTTTLMVGGTSTLRATPRVHTEAISVAPMPKEKAPEGAVAGGVAVGADDHVARPHVAVLRQDLVADAAAVAADVVELRDAVLGHEAPDQLLVRGGLGSLRRDPVVEDDGDAGGVPGLRLAARALVDLLELVDDQRRVLVGHGEIHLRLHHVPGLDGLQARRPGQDLLNDCHSHACTSLKRRPAVKRGTALAEKRGEGSRGQERDPAFLCAPLSFRCPVRVF